MRLGAPIYAVLWCLELLAGRLECRKEGHLWATQHPDRRRAGGHSVSIEDAIHGLTLLPTPRVTQAGYANDGRGGRSLAVEARRLLPTPNTMDGMEPRTDEALARAKQKGGCSNLKDIRPARWGEYAAAISSHERLAGRPAPAPTEPGRNGKPRLSPRFVEWMMCLPDGWVTDVPGVTRNEALKLLGNGVVPVQATHAIRQCLLTLSGADLTGRTLSDTLPDLLAEAWDDGHDAGCADPYKRYGECGCGPNPYKRPEEGR